MALFYRLLADATLLVHFAYVAFVVVGWLAIAVGGLLHWRWVRQRYFRALHFFMMAVVVAEAWLGLTCPLTTWEQQLRAAAGQATYRGGFVAALVHRLLFYDLPPWVFSLGYTLFGGAVLLTLILVPADWRPEKRPLVDGEDAC